VRIIYDRIRFICNGMATKRFHTMRTLQENTVAHHSFGVAMLVLELTEGNASADLLREALHHDLAEHVLGDMPAPAKRKMDIGKVVSAEEERLLGELWFPAELSEGEKRTLKIADALDGAMFCCTERKLGNTGITPIYEKFMSYVNERNPIGTETVVVAAVCSLWCEATR